MLEDFGQTVFSKVLSEENEEQLYRTAIEIIDYLHRNYNANANKKNGIFDYSEIELVKEARLFVDWYLKEHKQISLKEKSIIEGIESALERATKLHKPILFSYTFHMKK